MTNLPNDRNRGTAGAVNNTQARPPVSIEFDSNDHDYDAVTELFLGERTAVPASKTSIPKAKSLSEPLNVFKIVGRPEEMDDDEGELTAETSAFDSISPMHEAHTTTQIEAIVQGHLPVFAAAWVTQYARARAEELKRAVVLIRMRQGYSSVECVQAAGTPAMSMAPTPTIEEAIELARGMGARHWIIQTDELNEPALWRMGGVTRITILTGADGAALVSCFRVLSGISQAIGPESSMEIHVAVMGAAADKASEAIARVKTAGQELLGRQVGGSMAAAKIGAGAASSLYHSNADSTPLDSVIETIGEARTMPVSAPTPATETNTRASAVQREMAAMRASLLADAKTREAEQTETEAAAEQVPEVSVDEIESSKAGTRQTRPDSLIELIHDIEPLGIDCPGAGGVEFGIAPDGRIHLVAHVEGELNSGQPSTQSRAIEDLLVASAWATAHAKLLLGSNPAMRLDERDHSPILHVITSKPREARRLLDTNIRVHLIVPPQESCRWVSMELN